MIANGISRYEAQQVAQLLGLYRIVRDRKMSASARTEAIRDLKRAGAADMIRLAPPAALQWAIIFATADDGLPF